jgi:hypothetical protein
MDFKKTVIQKVNLNLNIVGVFKKNVIQKVDSNLKNCKGLQIC